MRSIKAKLQDLKFWVKTGIKTEYGEEDGWIRYKDIFIQVIKLENGNYSIAYTDSAPNSFPLKDMHIAVVFDKACKIPF